MSTRITDAMLEARVRRLNELTGSPLIPWSKVDGRNVANIGNFHLSGAYGGVCLHRMVNENGGIRTPIISYHTTKRHLYDLINAYMDGIYFAQEEQHCLTLP
jgi:hypothetical protein